MRLALASLIALGAVSTAVAQEQTAPTAPTAPAPATAPAADPAVQTPAAPADPMTATPTVAAPPAGQAPDYVAPTRGPPTTDPVSLQLLGVLDKVCKPAVVGGDFPTLAKAAGMKKKKEQWVMDIGKPYLIAIDNPGSNKNVCTVTIQYAQGDAQAQALANALHDWATWENKPQLRLIRNDLTVSDVKRLTVSWDDAWADGHAGLVYMRLKKLDDTSIGKNYEQAQILYSTTSR
ncbi:hypothetical protein [Caulobacter sp. UNC279MFTsu5.1]|uniref:hypothetical protein n=1 Tax=Caulobacter sp. UNC279MFTsu5.1 TaxID=1502775 RepID=UPI0008E0F0A9|nr:hypothetical protein [Caulobacter sp. UNC279MFTsu5.1]SFJ43133.1 hypothetical protein SAMN02799626_01780 [Caulobacter sp. UNC279MFTsu5.1]